MSGQSERLLLPEHSATSLDVVHCADALAWLRGAPSDWLNAVITSPPYYGLRSYLPDDHAEKGREIGLEDTPAAYVERLVAVFREIRRVLRPDGVVWLNLGDSYARNGGTQDGSGRELSHMNGTQMRMMRVPDDDVLKPKDLIGIPWRVAFALQADGWYLRSEITWCKTAPMPESVTDRPATATEKVFMLTKEPHYWYDAEAVRVKSSGLSGGGFSSAYAQNQPAHGAMRLSRPSDTSTRNLWNYWMIGPEPSQLGHFAMFPQALIEPMVLAGCPAQVCAVCGAPYERVVEVERSNYRTFDHPHRTGGAMSGGVGKNFPDTVRRDLGFEPTCSCAADTRPGIVFDPFMGSGTTALVAQRLGRHYIGTDLNLEYVELARTRLRYRGDDRRMMREQAAGVEQIALFEQEVA